MWIKLGWIGWAHLSRYQDKEGTIQNSSIINSKPRDLAALGFVIGYFGWFSKSFYKLREGDNFVAVQSFQSNQ